MTYRILKQVSRAVQCSCGAPVHEEIVLKGPNAGQVRRVDVNGARHQCRRRSRVWTDAEREFVRANYGPMSMGQLARHLNRGVQGVKAMIKKLNDEKRAIIAQAVIAADKTGSNIDRASLAEQLQVHPSTVSAEARKVRERIENME